jgi:hypothetical protein
MSVSGTSATPEGLFHGGQIGAVKHRVLRRPALEQCCFPPLLRTLAVLHSRVLRWLPREDVGRVTIYGRLPRGGHRRDSEPTHPGKRAWLSTCLVVCEIQSFPVRFTPFGDRSRVCCVKDSLGCLSRARSPSVRPLRRLWFESHLRLRSSRLAAWRQVRVMYG